MTTGTWTLFWFDGNLGFGVISSPEDWERIVTAYSGDLRGLLAAKEDPDTQRGLPSFGFYLEYNGQRTLGEWAAQQGMDLSSRKDPV